MGNNPRANSFIFFSPGALFGELLLWGLRSVVFEGLFLVGDVPFLGPFIFLRGYPILFGFYLFLRGSFLSAALCWKDFFPFFGGEGSFLRGLPFLGLFFFSEKELFLHGHFLFYY